MKRLMILGLALVILSVIPMQSHADSVVVSGGVPQTIKIGSNILVDDVCTFTIKSVKPYKMFMNTSSGDASTFLVVSFDIINWKTEPLYLRTQVKASLQYDESFDFEPTYLWANPAGTYHNPKTSHSSNLSYFIVYNMDESGILTSNTVNRGDYERPTLNAYNSTGYDNDNRTYNPEEDCFGSAQNDTYACIDSSKTVFDPLVKRTMHYVFTVPNIVAKDEGLRVLTLSIGGNDYQLTF